MKNAYKYRGGKGPLNEDGTCHFNRDINTLVNNQIHLPTKNHLNDPTEGFYDDTTILSFINQYIPKPEEEIKIYSGLLKKINEMGVYSLSNNVNNELLWAYYGGGHAGFAIEYDIDLLKKSMNHNPNFEYLFDLNVEYSAAIPVAHAFTLASKSVNDILKVYLGTKSLSWKHEDEYRIVAEKAGLVNIDYRIAKGIYFGYKMKEPEIEFIMERLKGRNLQYYKMELEDKKYNFFPKEIPDKFSNAPKYHPNNLTYNIDEILLCEGILGKEAYSYKSRLIEALEIVKHEPLITKIYQATIEIENSKPIFWIFADTGQGAPVKTFQFHLDTDNNLVRNNNI